MAVRTGPVTAVPRSTLRALPVVTSRDAPPPRSPGRTSFAYLVLGVISRVFAAMILLVEAPILATSGGWGSATALGLTHVIALGFATSISLGVLYHIVPQSTGRPLPFRGVGTIALTGYAAGVVLLVSGLGFAHHSRVAPGGAITGVALLVALAQLGWAVIRSPRRPMVHLFLLASGAALAIVAAAGALLAFAVEGYISLDVAAVLPAKILLGIGGWLGILVVGMSYVLMPMFTPTRARGHHQKGVLIALTTGFAGASASVLFHATMSAAVMLAVAAFGLAAFAIDVLRMARGATNGWRTPTVVGQLLGAALALVTACLAIAAVGFSSLELAIAAAVLALWGWVSCEIAANAIRLIPFMVWLVIPAPRRPQRFVPAGAGFGWVALGCAMATAGALAAGLLSGSALLVRTAGICDVIFAGTLVSIGIIAGRQSAHSAPPLVPGHRS